MSDSGRKRSRKTKLVPRDFTADDDCFLQDFEEPPIKLFALDKIKKKDGESSHSSASLEFSVKVEVEDIEDSVPEEDPSSYMKYLFSLAKDSSQDDDDDDDHETKTNPNEKCFIMDTHKMIKLFHVLHRKYPLEKEAVMHTRNAWGKVFYENPNDEIPRHPQDIELQKVLGQWKIWLFTSRSKETPFSYKCYICTDAWWSFMDFRDHVRQHTDCSIAFEVIQQESHIIAYEGSQPHPRDIHVDGKCFKCTNTFPQHLASKKYTDYRYYCTHCKDQFLTCRSLYGHEGICDKNPIRKSAIEDIISSHDKLTEYSCKVCEMVFLTKLGKYEHMSICHRVRSDEPISTNCKVCRVCDRTFHIFRYHVCPKKSIIHECKHCHGKFQNRQMLEAHMKLWGKPIQCVTCEKYIMKQCMAAEHYAQHSENFHMMYRCLKCTKVRLFYTDEAFRSHKQKFHRKSDSRRPNRDKIIVPKIMLEQCQVKPIFRRRKRSNVLEPTARTFDKTKDRSKTLSSTENQENVEKNVTTAEGNSLNNDQSLTEDSKDFPKLMNQITETLDIKPEIVVKEEKLSDTEDTKANLVKTIEQTEPKESRTKAEIPLSVRKQSDKFKQIIQEVQEIKLSNIFQVTKVTSGNKTVEIKQEVKQEPEEFEDDLIILDSSNESIKQESVASENTDLSLLNLEPEVILKAGYRKRKIYKCNKCDFCGYHREYKEHINNRCQSPPPYRRSKTEPSEENFICTKCGKGYATMKLYVQHFVDHNYRFMTCPQCVTMFDSITKLVAHINTHIKNQFVRIQLINTDEVQGRTKVSQCKSCKEVIEVKDSFSHWEGHLEIQDEPVKRKQSMVNSRKIKYIKGESALQPEALKRILELLQHQEGINNALPKKIKTCVICDRYFERQNDCKRHLIEHLLEDAYANIIHTEFLKCQICSATHRTPDTYKKHMRDHGSLPIYQCGLCDKTFSDSSNFTKHKKIHNLRAFVCDICHKKFQAKLSLEKHMEMHMSTDPFPCDRCDRVFYDRSFFNRHVRQHHERPNYRFKCMICKEKFECLRLKWDHMWEVHKQRKEKADCPLCNKSYRKISDVKKHTAMEHGLNMSVASVLELVDKYHSVCKEKGDGDKQRVSDNSDDDVMLIEEERETLVIYDDLDEVCETAE